MENNEPQNTNGSSKKMPMLVIAAVVVIIIVGAIVYSMSGNNTQQPEVISENQPNQQPPANEEVMEQAQYVNGTYDVVGNYTSPGGEESINVSLTLEGGIVTAAEVVSNATRPISKQMQAAFIGGFEEQVVGKNIDELNVTKVSSSSLTPKGFMDAVEKVKVEASA